jgi:hypothetical protein
MGISIDIDEELLAEAMAAQQGSGPHARSWRLACNFLPSASGRPMPDRCSAASGGKATYIESAWIARMSLTVGEEIADLDLSSPARSVFA